jgi:D-amino peptidase
MEGTTGVTGWSGATSVVVNGTHDGMRNIPIEDPDTRAEVITGLYKPLVMMEGVDDADIVFFTGYHAAAGAAGVLAHTMTLDFLDVQVNGDSFSEARLNAAFAGSDQHMAACVLVGEPPETAG